MGEDILITGGLGYLGGRIATYLCTKGYPLRLTTRRSAEHIPDWVSSLQGIKIIKIDLLTADFSTIQAICSGVDTVIHLAAMNENRCLEDPIMSVRINCEISVKLIEAARSAGVKRFIYFSTAHVYGTPLCGVITEECVPRPRHPYAITHRMVEDFVLAEQAKGEMNGLVFRLSNAIGPPADNYIDRWTLVVNDLCRQAVTKGQLVLKTDGSQQRDFIPISDVVRAVLHFLELPSSKWGDGLFNLGRGQSMSILEMAQLIAERAKHFLRVKPAILRPEVRVSERPLRPLEYRIDKIRDTGYECSGSIVKEVDATLRFCQESFE